MRLLSLTQCIWRPSVPQFSSSGTHRINTRSNVTVPDVSVFHHKESLCWDWVLDYVSMRLLSLTQFIWRPSVPQLCCSGTHRINTRSNVTVPDVSCIPSQESQLFEIGLLDYVSMRLPLPHTFIWRPSVPSSPALALTESIHVVMSLYLMWVYSITRSQLCWDWVLDYVSMRLLLPHTIHLETIGPQFSQLWHSQNQYT